MLLSVFLVHMVLVPVQLPVVPFRGLVEFSQLGPLWHSMLPVSCLYLRCSRSNLPPPASAYILTIYENLPCPSPLREQASPSSALRPLLGASGAVLCS